jgi:hypothetical protein
MSASAAITLTHRLQLQPMLGLTVNQLQVLGNVCRDRSDQLTGVHLQVQDCLAVQVFIV